MSELEQAAHELVAGHLGGRVLPQGVRAAIEQAVREQMREGFTTEMDIALRQLIETYADAVGASSGAVDNAAINGDDSLPTVVDVHWTSIG